MKRRNTLLLSALLSISVGLSLPILVPQALAFPHYATSGGHRVWSESPIDKQQLDGITAKANALVAASPTGDEDTARDIFLTKGEWRWRWLALGSGASGAMAFSRPVGELVIFNRNSIARDDVTNGERKRRLSSTIAHEIAHGQLRDRVGLLRTVIAPTWKVEGYCDFVARESALSDADYARVKTSNPDHPAIVYYEGRRKVAAILARNGNDVDALFGIKPK